MPGRLHWPENNRHRPLPFPPRAHEPRRLEQRPGHQRIHPRRNAYRPIPQQFPSNVRVGRPPWLRVGSSQHQRRPLGRIQRRRTRLHLQHDDPTIKQHSSHHASERTIQKIIRGDHTTTTHQSIRRSRLPLVTKSELLASHKAPLTVSYKSSRTPRISSLFLKTQLYTRPPPRPMQTYINLCITRMNSIKEIETEGFHSPFNNRERRTTKQDVLLLLFNNNRTETHERNSTLLQLPPRPRIHLRRRRPRRLLQTTRHPHGPRLRERRPRRIRLLPLRTRTPSQEPQKSLRIKPPAPLDTPFFLGISRQNIETIGPETPS